MFDDSRDGRVHMHTGSIGDKHSVDWHSIVSVSVATRTHGAIG